MQNPNHCWAGSGNGISHFVLAGKHTSGLLLMKKEKSYLKDMEL